jgi:hypothetical protein
MVQSFVATIDLHAGIKPAPCPIFQRLMIG